MLLVVADTTGDSVKRGVTLFLPLLLTVNSGLPDILPITLELAVTLPDSEMLLEELNVSLLLVVADTTGEAVKRAVILFLPLLLTVPSGLPDILPITLELVVTLPDADPD